MIAYSTYFRSEVKSYARWKAVRVAGKAEPEFLSKVWSNEEKQAKLLNSRRSSKIEASI